MQGLREVTHGGRYDVLGPHVGKDKDRSRQLGRERLGAIIFGQDSILPKQQVGVDAGKFFPRLFCLASRHALVDEENVSPGYGLMVKLGFSQSDREFSQGIGKYL